MFSTTITGPCKISSLFFKINGKKSERKLYYSIDGKERMRTLDKGGTGMKVGEVVRFRDQDYRVGESGQMQALSW